MRSARADPADEASAQRHNAEGKREVLTLPHHVPSPGVTAGPSDRGVFWLWTALRGAAQLRRFDPTTEALEPVASAPAALPTSGAMAYLPSHRTLLLYSAEADSLRLYAPDTDEWTERPDPNDPNERINRYLVPDPLDDLVVVFNVAAEFRAYRCLP